MNITLKLTLFKGKTYADGTHPIQLRYTIDRKVKRKGVYKCHLNDWDFKTDRVKSKVTNSAYINNFLSEKFAEAEKDLFALKKGEKKPDQIFQTKKALTLQEVFDTELLRLTDELKSGYYDKVKAIQKQIPDTGISINDINEVWFEKMIQFMYKLGNTGNTVKKKIKLMRGIVSRYAEKGVTKEMEAISVPTNKTIKLKLDRDDLLKLELLVLPDGDLTTAARDLFLMQIYLRGSRIGALLQAYSNQFEKGRYIAVNDQGKNNVDSNLIPKAQVIVDKYKDKHQRLFPFFNWAPDEKLTKFENQRKKIKHKEVCTTVVNKYLKVIAVMAGISKPLSSHIARHTFARMAIDKVSNPMKSMELLGHSSLIVHQNYLNDIKKDDELDRATEEIFS
ncbi:tyrosine-type recombinase/integrase [Pedobacter sp. PAMC26386]|nr:tyrosine-type recombinase/integrase [Pedobacter sp. PAMC26386]